jgi:hypothetical protein
VIDCWLAPKSSMFQAYHGEHKLLFGTKLGLLSLTNKIFLFKTNTINVITTWLEYNVVLVLKWFVSSSWDWPHRTSLTSLLIFYWSICTKPGNWAVILIPSKSNLFSPWYSWNIDDFGANHQSITYSLKSNQKHTQVLKT